MSLDMHDVQSCGPNVASFTERARQHVLPDRQRCCRMNITTSQVNAILRKFMHEVLRLLHVSC
jgi:hypothetical protein